MRTVIASAALLCLAALPALAQDRVPAGMHLEMTPGMVQLLRTDAPVRNVLVGRSEVADIAIVTDRTIAITAHKDGFTSLMFLGEDNAIVNTADIMVTDSRLIGRTLVRVHTFEKAHSVDQYTCEAHSAACSFLAPEKAPMAIDAGPVVAPGVVANAAPVLK